MIYLHQPMLLLYQPYLKEINEIENQAYILNNRRSFTYNFFVSMKGDPPITSDIVIEYLTPHYERLKPIIDERAAIHAWLLRISNRLYNPSLVFRLLPAVLLEGLPSIEPQHSSEADQIVLRKAETDKEFTLIRKRLLLRTML